MQTINNRMTATQVADLFSLAVQLQVKAEESDDRDTAILAYSIQNACSNLTESRREFRAADATINNLELKITDMAEQLANAESKCRDLAAESDKTSERMQQLIQIINNADNDYCMCGDAMKNHTHGGCGHPTGMFDYHYNQWLQAENKTPATDAFLAEVRAQESKRVYESILDNPAVTDMASLVDWLEQNANDSVAFAAQLRKGAAL
ncbi:hypothetical protein [Citrobacter braakii]|uniref:hypothetical protein n=1 Tax=Citrobacter braakii TaxID=57706 RepID=UPI001F5BAFA5|nr:hypothetical protein [Citrobacter braakii]